MAFENCINLLIIEMNQYYTQININAFENCQSLKTLDLANYCIENSSVEPSTFNILKEIIIPSSIKSIDDFTFSNLFLSIIYKTNSIDEICTLNDAIKVQNNIKIPQSLRQIAQTIYKIRSNLRFKKQNGTKNDYLKLFNNFNEKSHFLLQFHSGKFKLNEISNFLNDNVKVSQIIQEQTKLESVKKHLDLFIYYKRFAR